MVDVNLFRPHIVGNLDTGLGDTILGMPSQYNLLSTTNHFPHNRLHLHLLSQLWLECKTLAEKLFVSIS